MYIHEMLQTFQNIINIYITPFLYSWLYVSDNLFVDIAFI